MTALAALKEELLAYTPAAEMTAAVLAPVRKIDSELDEMSMALRVAWVEQTEPQPATHGIEFVRLALLSGRRQQRHVDSGVHSVGLGWLRGDVGDNGSRRARVE